MMKMKKKVKERKKEIGKEDRRGMPKQYQLHVPAAESESAGP